MSGDAVQGRPDLLLMLHEGLPDVFEEEAREQLEPFIQNFMVIRQPGGPYTGVELYLPTAVALFVAAGFFNGALQEAGKDAYVALKNVASKLWHRTGKVNVTTSGSAGKVSPDRKFSLAYSITGEVARGLNFKLLMQTEISHDDAEAGIEAFFGLLNDLLNDRVAESDAEALLTYKPVGGIVLVTFDSAARKIVPINAFTE